MNFEADLNLTLRARYPLIYIPSAEEERVEASIINAAKSLGRSIFVWDFVDGYQSNPTDAGMGKRNPLQALEFIDKIPKGAVFVLRDFDRFSKMSRSRVSSKILLESSKVNRKILL